MINLLPPKEREVLISEENFKITLILGILFLIFLFSLSLLLSSLKIYISKQVDSEREKITLYQKDIETSEAQALKERISTFNADLSESVSFFDKQVFLTDIFEEINQLLPESTYLTSFFYQEEGREVSLLGFAPTREVLFELKKNFESKEMIKDFNFPLLNWVKPKDIEFHLRFKIDL